VFASLVDSCLVGNLRQPNRPKKLVGQATTVDIFQFIPQFMGSLIITAT
jgi:regulator of RNase E activity RraA